MPSMSIPESGAGPRSQLESRICNDFAYHSPDEGGKKQCGQVREWLKNVAIGLVSIVPPGREQSLMLTSLEEAMHWANAGIAKQHPISD